MSEHRILIVDDDVEMQRACLEALEALSDVRVEAETVPAKALRRLEAEPFDLLITDLRMPGMDGRELLKESLARSPGLPVLVLTGYPTVQTAVECLKLGAVDYISKPFAADELVANVRRCLKERRLEEENALLQRRLSHSGRFGDLIGTSPAMKEVHDVLARVAATDVDVLIQGETGTGKELVARALHQGSRRAGKRFVPVDSGAIPEQLLESELFGHEKGAFTGADARSVGLLEYADGGTLFLDELGELPLQLQAKLLRALQERRIRRLGAKAETSIDVRVVAATHVDLHKAAEEGRFRQDLYFRVNVVNLVLPPLRERGDDVRLLAEHFVAVHAPEQHKVVTGFDGEALEVLLAYSWPGNVRELQNVVRRAIALTKSEQLGVDDLPPKLIERAGRQPGRRAGFFKRRTEHLAVFEREYLRATLAANAGDAVAAAKEAEVPRATYYRLLKNYGIRPADFRPAKS